MRKFRVGDIFKGRKTGLVAKVTAVRGETGFDASVDVYCGEVLLTSGDRVNSATIPMSWDLIREG